MKRCIYCGKPVEEGIVINPGAEWELVCCDEPCRKAMEEFSHRDARTKTPFYLILAVFVVANMFLFGFQPDTRWQFLPMLGICVAVLVHPFVFSRYNMYQRFGVVKTMRIIRAIVAVLLVFGIVAMLLY